jgi:hypothetical protein
MFMTGMEESTTISISRSNHARLQELGRKGATFDDIITQVLDRKTRLLLPKTDSGGS